MKLGHLGELCRGEKESWRRVVLTSKNMLCENIGLTTYDG